MHVTSKALPVKTIDLTVRRGRRLGQERRHSGPKSTSVQTVPAAAARDTPWKPSQPRT